MSHDNEDEHEVPGASSPEYSRYVLGALFVLYIFNFIDRQLLNLFLEPIKQEFGASDTAMGALTGLAFALFYTIAGFPLARWADRNSRTALITAGLVVWSAMTALSGWTRSFAQLALARVGVGVGEASFTPSSHSLLTDYFPPEKRATALATFAAGASVGNVLGFFGGGLLADSIGWRNTFVFLGLVGLPIALIFRLTVREPKRSAPPTPRPESILTIWRALMSRPAFLFLAVSASLHGFSSYGSTSWIAAFLIRIHDLSLFETGAVMALTSGVAATVGQIVAGRLADHLGKRDVRWYMYLPAITSVLTLPFLVAFLLMDDLTWAILLYVPGSLLASMWTGPTYAMGQSLAKPHMRAMASAILVFLLNLIGMGLGPLVVGVLNDVFAPHFGTDAIRYSLMLAIIPHSLAAIFNLRAARTLREDIADASS
ncbi:MFS transporter [Myxococcota bacterium]|nr:MFS transporter [Myxococcota bacterium]